MCILQNAKINRYEMYARIFAFIIHHAKYVSPSKLRPVKSDKCWLLLLCVFWTSVCFFLAQQPQVGQGLLIYLVSRSHMMHHSRYDSSGWVISLSQRPLRDNTQHLQQSFTPLVGFEPTVSAGERPQIYAFERVATGTGILNLIIRNAG
jgi:hypothetical protein